MKSYKQQKRKRRITLLALIAGLIAATIVWAYFFFPSLRGDEVAVLPTNTPFPTDTPAPTPTDIPPSPTPYPVGSEWDLTTEGLTEWQLMFLLTDLNKFWTAYMAPEGLMDCVSALNLVTKSVPTTAEGIEAECVRAKEAGVFDTSLPLDKLKLAAVRMFPDKGYIGLQLDTGKEWPSEVRYFSDNGLKKVVTMERILYNVILVYEDGMWRVVGLDTLVEGEDF